MPAGTRSHGDEDFLANPTSTVLSCSVSETGRESTMWLENQIGMHY